MGAARHGHHNESARYNLAHLFSHDRSLIPMLQW